MRLADKSFFTMKNEGDCMDLLKRLSCINGSISELVMEELLYFSARDKIWKLPVPRFISLRFLKYVIVIKYPRAILTDWKERFVGYNFFWAQVLKKETGCMGDHFFPPFRYSLSSSLMHTVSTTLMCVKHNSILSSTLQQCL